MFWQMMKKEQKEKQNIYKNSNKTWDIHPILRKGIVKTYQEHILGLVVTQFTDTLCKGLPVKSL